MEVSVLEAHIASKVMEALRTTSTQSMKHASLKPGQMVTGKVLKLFPGQRALIQVGNQQMNAQLEAALNLHGRYMFQVQSAEDLIHLKVLGETGGRQSEKGLASLFSQLGMAYQKDRASLVKQLIKQQIPFQQNELKQGFALMEKFTASPETKQVLQDMITRKLPMKESIFLALRERLNSTSTLTSSIQQLESMQSGKAEGSLQLSQFLSRHGNQQNSSFKQQLIGMMIQHSERQQNTNFSLLQKAQLISSDQNQSNWTEQVNKWSSMHGGDNTGKSTTWQGMPHVQNNESTTAKQFVDLFQKQLPFSKGEQQQLRTWSENLSRLLGAGSEATDRALQQVKHASHTLQQERVMNKLISPVENQGVTKEGLRELLNLLQNASSSQEAKQQIERLRPVSQAVQDLANSQLSKQETRTLLPMLSSITQEHPELLSTGKNYFLSQLKTVMQQSGLNYEYQLMNQPDGMELMKTEATLKGSILQSLQEGMPAQVSDKLSSVLNHLNGMVLSMQDNDQILQMNLQLPGEWFGIEQDLIMDMEGKKNEQDEVDPDYCHILFYLQLQSLDETVIDMRIQKRIVQLTLYTGNNQAEALIKSFKPMLEEGLEKLDYKLSTVRHRSLQAEAAVKENNGQNRYTKPYSQGGLDFRV